MVNSEYYRKRNWLISHKDEKEIEYKNIDIYHPERGWALIPGLKNRLYKNSTVNSNSSGARGGKEFFSGMKNALFMGDSFCFGEGVNDNETIPYFFEEAVKSIQSINLGVHGYGIDQQYLYLKEAGQKYKPNLICFIICYEDFNRNFADFRDYAKPKFVLKGNSIILTNYPVPEPEYYLKSLKEPSSFPILLDFFMQILTYYGIIGRRKRERICAYILDEIRQIANELNSNLVFLYIPNYLNKLLGNYIDTFFISFFRKRNITYLNLGDIFTNQELEDMTDRPSGHFGAKSNKLIADKLAELVKKHGLV